MASGDSCCKLLVENLPDEMIDDDDGLVISLFFESDSLCPGGGDVDSVELHPDHRKAVITFTDPEVVSRLLKRKTVDFQGTSLTIQSFKNEEVSDEENANDADDGASDESDEDDIKGGSCNSHDSKKENESSCEIKCENDRSESDGEENADDSAAEAGGEEETGSVDGDEHPERLSDEDLSQTNIELNRSDCHPSHAVKDVSSDEYCSLEEVDVGSDTQRAEADPKEGRTELPESHSKDNGGNFSETDEENLSEEEQRNENTPNQSAPSVEDKEETLLPAEELEDLTSVSTELCKDNTILPPELDTGEVKLSSEKVKLLKVLSDAQLLGESVMQVGTTFDADKGKVILAGSTDNIMTAKLYLYEKAFSMSNFRVEMRKQTSELLFMVRGAEWLEREFQQRQINAVLYQRDNSINMVALDDNSYEVATEALQEILADRVIPFQDDHLEYLRSAAWKKSMEEFCAKEIVQICVDFDSSKITVEGHADSVRSISETISALLKTNSKVTESIKLRKGSLRLLKERKDAVSKTITEEVLKNLGDEKVELEFKEACIELRGTRNAVEEATRVISDKYLSSIHHLQYEINKPGVTIEAFTIKDSFGEDIIDGLEMKHKCVIEVRERDQAPRNIDGTKDSADILPDWKLLDASGGLLDNVKSAVSFVANTVLASVWDPKPDPSVPTSVDVPKIASNITIQTGSLVDFQADVLVNPIAHSTRHLMKAGAVSKSFYKKGTDSLQQEFEQVGSPRKFGSGISATSNAAGVFPCKKIYHVAIRHFRDDQSIELMKQMIEECLKTAEGENMTSIAFPTVGCGKLGYNLKDVVRCFNEAAIKSTVQVYIIGYEQATCDAFTSYLTQPSLKKPQEPVQQKLEVPQSKPAPSPAAQTNAVTPSPSTTKTSSSLVRTAIVFHIVALDKESAEKARGSLAKKLSECLTDAKIERELIAHLSDDMISTIRKCAGKIDVRIDKQNKTIALSGHHASVRQTKTEIDRLLAEEEKNSNDLQYIKRTKGVPAYLSKLATTENLQLPKYWTHYKKYDQQDIGSIKTALQPGTEVYKAVEAMVTGTWEARLVGQGHDAANLKHSGITIKNIYAVENLYMFHSYKSQLKNLSYRASRNLFKPVTSLQGEVEIATKSLPDAKYLYDDLVSEVNEYYLLHGTSRHETIVKSGIDFRFSGDKVLFGKGAYFAEKSIKADQYADAKDKRKPNGEKLYMFVARVLLGEPHLCQKPYSYKKAPCSDASCQSESCSSDHLPCDSVIGTHRPATTGTPCRLLFREFIIYHTEQCYPEFLVEYIRQ